jgi:MoaA/NifB/PqqE/SkfB family radical SAM enzyme
LQDYDFIEKMPSWLIKNTIFLIDILRVLGDLSKMIFKKGIHFIFKNINSLLLRKALRSKSSTCWHYPRRVEFVIINQCNANCIMCGDIFDGKKLDIRQFKRIAKQTLPFAKEAGFIGGELLLHPGFYNISEYAYRFGVQLSMTTNLSVLTTDRADALNYFFKSIIISIDSPRKETYEMIRIGLSFDRLKKNLSRISEIKRQNGMRVSIAFVAMRQIIEELPDMVDFAVDYGLVRNLKIVDELFILNEAHYMPILQGIIRKGVDLNIWAYARVDTIKFANLPVMKKAGINWLALGIKSANPDVRGGVFKQIRKADIETCVARIKEAGIHIIGNYIFGLPGDTLETMRETLDLALKLNCEFVNFYCAMAYPGSRLYDMALKEGWELPGEWHGYSQHAYETLPLPTQYLPVKVVLQFRDDAFQEYFSHPDYLDMITNLFGERIKRHIREITKKN